MQTTDAGVFSAPALVPAAGYSLSVAKQGFDNWEIKDFPITVGQTVDFKVTLQVGATTTRVDVTGEVPLVEDTKSGVTATVGHDQIDNLSRGLAPRPAFAWRRQLRLRLPANEGSGQIAVSATKQRPRLSMERATGLASSGSAAKSSILNSGRRRKRCIVC